MELLCRPTVNSDSCWFTDPYGAGQVAGEVINVAVQNLTPCRFVGVARQGVRALQAVQGTANLLDAGDAFQSGNVLQGMTSLANARASFGSMMKSCFAAGTPLLTPTGSKPIEEFNVGDEVLSRDEHDISGPVVVRRVVQTFVRVSPILNLHIGGRIIKTTGEHPFFVVDKGWVPASGLRIGDTLVSHDGQLIPVDGIADSGRIATVYNLEIEDDHTYFVGSEAWGWDIWAHNAQFYHYTSKAGAKGINGGGVIKANKPGYSGHGVTGPVVFVTPLNPTALQKKGLGKIGLTNKKATHVVAFDYPKDNIKSLPGGRGKYIKYIEGNVQLPPGIKALPVGK